MQQREVTAVSVDRHGYVTKLINPAAEWSPQSTVDAMLDLELGQVAYFVNWPEGRCVVLDKQDHTGRYLTAHRDTPENNSLLDLPRVDADRP